MPSSKRTRERVKAEMFRPSDLEVQGTIKSLYAVSAEVAVASLVLDDGSVRDFHVVTYSPGEYNKNVRVSVRPQTRNSMYHHMYALETDT